MELLDESCRQAASYPYNLIGSNVPPVELEAIQDELEQQAPRVFCNDDAASVDFLEVQNPGEVASLKFVRSEDDLRKILGSATIRQKRDPICRMIFFYAPNARQKLNVTLRMALQILSYHQVVPSFLEGIFSFGLREHSQECNITSFQAHNRLSSDDGALRVPELGRSGAQLEHCYGLRSVERSNGQVNWPWSVRQCSIYHSLDLQSGHATWIVVKANRLVEKYGRDILGSEPYQSSMGRSVADAIAAALAIHELLATWSGTNWQGYINFMEDKVQQITRTALSVSVDDGKVRGADYTAPPTQLSSEIYDLNEKSEEKRSKISPLRQVTQSIRSLTKSRPPTLSTKSEPKATVIRHNLSFDDLPRLHYLEEKTNEALDVLRNNESVLEALKNEYSAIQFTNDEEQSKIMTDAYEHFVKTIDGVQKSSITQQRRLRQLLRLLGDRKALLQRILDYEAMQANRLLAEQAGASAKNMEDIAVKTKLETVSMRIITLVTLFFLPGTFISTLMSTPIVRFAPGSPSTSDSNISLGALSFFCAISLPLVVLTFTSWGVVYWWENRKERKRQLIKELQGAAEPP